MRGPQAQHLGARRKVIPWPGDRPRRACRLSATFRPLVFGRIAVEVPALSVLSHSKYLHHLVSQVIDDLDGDAAGLRAVKGARDVAVKGRQASWSISAFRVALSAL